MHTRDVLEPHKPQRDFLPLLDLVVRELDDLRRVRLLRVLHVVEPERRPVDEQLDRARTLAGLAGAADNNGLDAHGAHELCKGPR